MVYDICISIGVPKVKECIDALKDVDFAEIRMDKMKLLTNDIERIFSHKRLIATCRPGEGDEKRKKLLISAIGAGAKYVDIELESDEIYLAEIIEKARGCKCKVIVSYHNNKCTPSSDELAKIVNKCFTLGADIAKISCMVNSKRDNAKLLGLLDTQRKMIVIGMGERGRIVRLIAPLLGSLFTYASISQGNETANGQIDFATMRKGLKELAELGGVA